MSDTTAGRGFGRLRELAALEGEFRRHLQHVAADLASALHDDCPPEIVKGLLLNAQRHVKELVGD
jgi:hypothetical protein